MAPQRPVPQTRYTREHIAEWDRADPLAGFRDAFDLPDDVIYLDGNSLGALPKRTKARLQALIADEWGRDLITSWNAHDWVTMPTRVGDKIARLIGARPGEVIAADSTSVNLYKAVSAAVDINASATRRVIVTEQDDFPTDAYVLHGVARRSGDRVRVEACSADDLYAAITEETAVVVLSHVHYKTAHKHDMGAVTRRAHDCGALVVWDLSHSVGAVDVDLNAAGADFAVGCGYKYLNGGPGAPAFLFAAQRLHDRAHTPIPGWFGHAHPFAFDDQYAPAPDASRFLCGTPPVVSMAALEEGVDLMVTAPMDAIVAKSQRMCRLFTDLVEERCAGHGVGIAGPREAERRGSHVSLTHPHGYAIMRSLIDRGVIGDFREPDIFRFGFTPLYLRYTDVWDAASALSDVLETKAWANPAFQRRLAVP